MSMKHTEIAQVLTRWLERFTPPVSIRDNQRAAQDAADALLRTILRFAPHSDYTPWVHNVLDRVEYQMKTRAWPTVNEVGAVCSNLRKESPKADGAAWTLDRFEIAAKRIREKQPVGDNWIYGPDAHELVTRGLATESDLDAYRSGLFFRLKDAWGPDRAAAVEDEFRRRHGLSRKNITAGAA